MKLFELGTIEVSSEAMETLTANNLTSEYLLLNHQQGYWSDLDELSRQKNDAGIHDDLMLTSRYILSDSTELFICTAGGRGSAREM